MAKYKAKEVEDKIRKFWDKEKVYKFNPKRKGKVFSIDTPPPYASSGHLHVGHALHYTQFEIMARVMRMLGRNVYFPPGFDDNGLPTEKFVEESLGINKNDVERSEFRKKCLEESKKVEKDFADKVLKTLGHSYDWDLLYTTISPEAQKVSQKAFLKLVKQDDCYRKEEPVLWCPYHQTALAQADVEDEERTTKLNHLYFDLEKGEKIEIATTRPEFLPACVGVFVNPKDKRYKGLIGKNAIVPIFGDKIPIMKDESVDMEFGSGVLMVCTFGDAADLDKWKRLDLPLKTIINEDGTLNEKAGKYKRMRLKEAREKILQELKEKDYLIKQEQIPQTVGVCERCNTPVEYVVKPQWFIKTLDYKKDLIKRAKEINWYPKFMRNRFEDWTNNLGWDWIISRQRYYGVPIPVWYCDECDEIILPEEKELPLDPMEVKKMCPKCGKKARGEEDVFDTWMTSSNSPEVAGQWLENKGVYDKVSPFSLRPQAQDIIRTWAFYTILKSHLLFDRIPWKDVMIGTFVLDEKGRGMSKSKGNVVWADKLIEKYGVDVFRYWVGNAKVGSDISFNENDLVAGRKFLNKLWNASNFVFMNLKDYKRKPKELMEIDKMMLQKVNEMNVKVKKQYQDYNIVGAKKTVENFFWHMFCDNYLEIVKKRIYNNMDGKESAQYTLYTSLKMLLQLIAPIMPFITEEIYRENFEGEKEKSIHLTKWPEEVSSSGTDESSELDLFIDILSKIRQEKTKVEKPMNAECVVSLPKSEQEKLQGMIQDLKNVTNASEIKEGKFKVEFN